MRVHVRASPNRALGRSLVVGAFPRRPRGRARRRPCSSSSVSSSFQRARGARRRRRSWDDRGAVRGARGETFGRGVRRRARASRTRVVDGDAKLTRETVVRGRWTTRDAWREKPARAQGASGGERRLRTLQWKLGARARADELEDDDESNRSSLSVEWKDDPAMDADEFYQNRADDLTYEGEASGVTRRSRF